VGVALRIAAATLVAAVPGLRQFHAPFPEGFTRAQMIQRVALDVRLADGKLKTGKVKLSALGYRNASAKAVVPCFGTGVQTNLEGFLFPSSYAFDIRTLGQNIVRNQLAAFCAAWGKLDLSYAESKSLAPYDVLKIASMVEAEAAGPADRAKVAAVIYNRLRLDMPLQIDATLRYGLHIPPTKSITQAQLQSDNPYNTRKLKGLPPTPICNPGLASMRAAAKPSTLGYLYYARVPGTKTQKFFESYTAYEQFLAANGYGPHP
jgi:uncharacterized YceG family protein